MKHILLCIIALGFYLGIYNGNLAIMEEGRSKPAVLLPYKAAMFPKEDQERLKAGITFKNPDELGSLLEDFLS